MNAVKRSQRETLIATLEAAVPLWIMHVSALAAEQRNIQIQAWATEGATEVASHGDILQYGSKKRGEVANVFNALARGLAALSFCPGGVRFMDRLWCARHIPLGRAAHDSQTCQGCLDDPLDESPSSWPVTDQETLKTIKSVETLLPREDFL